MIDAVLILLGVFILFAVGINIFVLRKRNIHAECRNVFRGNTRLETQEANRSDFDETPVHDPIAEQRISAQEEVEPLPQQAQPQSQVVQQSSLISLFVMNPSCQSFDTQALLSALSTIGCSHGEMSIFHYHQAQDVDQRVLFSVAQAVNPGVFNLAQVEKIQCPGVVFFMDAAMVDDPYAVFNLMLEKAQSFAQMLQAELYQTPNQPINDKSQSFYEEQLRYATQLKASLNESL